MVSKLKMLDIILGHVMSHEHSLYTQFYNEILNPRDGCSVLKV